MARHFVFATALRAAWEYDEDGRVLPQKDQTRLEGARVDVADGSDAPANELETLVTDLSASGTHLRLW